MEDLLQLVDATGRTIGSMDKLEAHRNGGTLHRAISVFLFDEIGRTLLQRRSSGKYHFPGRLANACCSHPIGEETPLAAAHKTLMRELGIECEIVEVGVVTYRADDPTTDLAEWEYDHVFAGVWAGPVFHNPMEVDLVRWIAPETLRAEVQTTPEAFAPWLPIIVESLASECGPFAMFRNHYLGK